MTEFAIYPNIQPTLPHRLSKHRCVVAFPIPAQMGTLTGANAASLRRGGRISPLLELTEASLSKTFSWSVCSVMPCARNSPHDPAAATAAILFALCISDSDAKSSSGFILCWNARTLPQYVFGECTSMRMEASGESAVSILAPFPKLPWSPDRVMPRTP